MLLIKRLAEILILLCAFLLFSSLNLLSVLSQDPPTEEPSPVEIPNEAPLTAVPPSAIFTDIPPPTATNTELPSPTLTETQTETPTETAVPLTETATATASETASATLLPITETLLVTAEATQEAFETTQEAETTAEPDAPSSNSFSLLEEEEEYYAMINFDDPTLLEYTFGERVTGDGNVEGEHEILSGVGYNGTTAYKATATYYDTSWFALLVIVVELDPSWEVLGFGGLVKSEVDGTQVGQASYVRYHTAGGGWSGLIGLTAGEFFGDWRHRYYRPASALTNIDQVQYEIHLRGSSGARLYLDDWHAVLTTPVPTPTATPTPPTLADFGITLIADDDVTQPWAVTEQTNILNAVNTVSDALALFGTIGNTNPDKFKTVMGTEITFLRLTSAQPSSTPYDVYYGTPDGNCQVWDPTTVINTIVVACRGFMLQTNNWLTGGFVTEYAVVHELGHVLDIRSGTQLRGYVGDSQSLSLVDCDDIRVMGIAAQQSWARGQRGWGSTAPDSGSGQEISQFQQNPYDQTNAIETAADMFLNWVYRRTTDDAPTNIPTNFDPLEDEFPAPEDACNYAEQGNWDGFENIDRDGDGDESKPGNVRYWWIEGTLNVIFLDEEWK